MKKHIYIFLSLALICFGADSFAQENKFAIGIEAGGSRSLSYGNVMLKNNTKAIFRGIGGLEFQYNFNSVFAIKTGLTYEQKGFKVPFFWHNSPEYTGTLKYLHNYLSIPVLVRASFGNKFRYFVNTGPYIGFVMNHKYLIEYPRKTEEKNLNDKFYSHDYGILIGAGAIYPLNSKIDIYMELRNNLGLANISNGSDPFAPSGVIYKTNSQNLLIGCSYKLGDKN